MLAAEIDGMLLLCLFGIPLFSISTVLAVGLSRRHAAVTEDYEDPRALANRLVKESTTPLTAVELESIMGSVGTVTTGPWQP